MEGLGIIPGMVSMFDPSKVRRTKGMPWNAVG